MLVAGSHARVPKQDPAFIAALTRHNQLDLRLYEYGRQLYEQRMAALVEKLQVLGGVKDH